MASGFRLAFLALAGDLAYRFLAGTARIEIHGGAHAEKARANGKGVIFALWHGRLLLGARAHEGHRTAIMISRHGDGEIIARIVARHGYVPVRGSTTRGGGSAFRELVTLSESGVREFAFTPDGPRGPRHRVQPGVVQFASDTGCVIVPSSASVKSGRFLKSWDRFLLPYPFARMVVVYGEPLSVPSDLGDAGLRAAAHKLEEAMIAVEAEADRRAGWTAS